MSQHNELGKKGEDLAASFLSEKGWNILERNWRFRRNEIDIIAFDGSTLVFTEVKSRKNNLFGEPEEAVTLAKIKRLVLAADHYIRQKRLSCEARFDVISVIGEQPPYQIKHFENAFLPPVF